MNYPVGIQTFETIIKNDYVYIDKTDLVYRIASGHIYFLSRPRRFGKSLLLSTFEAYFSGNKDLFKGLKIESLESEWISYPIFRIDFAEGDFTEPDGLNKKLEEYLNNWEKIYGKSDAYDTLSGRFRYLLEAAEKKAGHKAVVLIDEYDKPMLDVLGTELEEKNRNTLKGFYGTFKSADASLRFVFLTGVTKFSQVSVFSGFNQPKDISMNSQYDAICGITEEELYSYFAEQISEMAEQMELTDDQMKTELKKQYDGYHFSNKMLDIYNPFSILNAFDNMEIDDYWYSTSTPSYLIKLLGGHNINIQELTGGEYEKQYFVDYRADSEEPLAMLYQSGYLTIKGFDKRNRVYKLDFPNEEVKKGFVSLMANDYFSGKDSEDGNWIVNLNRMLIRGDLDGIRNAFTSFLASIPYEANKDERAKDFETHFSYTFYLINRLLSCYTTLIEKQNSKGRADVIIESDNDIYILEFKLDGSAKDALNQIEEKQYDLPYLNDSRTVHKIGVNISSESRTVSEWLVK